jgi:hypothetical protein
VPQTIAVVLGHIGARPTITSLFADPRFDDLWDDAGDDLVYGGLGEDVFSPDASLSGDDLYSGGGRPPPLDLSAAPQVRS